MSRNITVGTTTSCSRAKFIIGRNFDDSDRRVMVAKISFCSLSAEDTTNGSHALCSIFLQHYLFDTEAWEPIEEYFELSGPNSF